MSEDTVGRKVRSYESNDLVVEYDVKRCIHAAECVKRQPEVFDPDRRPWIDPTQADSAPELAGAIEHCPTGALQYRWKVDGQAAEEPESANTLRVEPDGPVYVRGDLRVHLESGEVVEETRLALCRCGESKIKPYCDNSHVEAEFEADGVLKEPAIKVEAESSATLKIEPLPDGPVLLAGRFTVKSADGSEHSGTGGALCRCGHSANKPFCDGSHRDVGFEST